MSDDIRFYRSNEKPFGVFSNLYRCRIEFEDRSFLTAEHAYQYGKPSRECVRDWLMQAPTPSLLALTAHELPVYEVRSDWARIKVDRMERVLRAKFTQWGELRDLLLSTGEARIVEAGTVNNAVNRFWGEVNGKGQNTLGRLLMKVRAEFR